MPETLELRLFGITEHKLYLASHPGIGVWRLKQHDHIYLPMQHTDDCVIIVHNGATLEIVADLSHTRVKQVAYLREPLEKFQLYERTQLATVAELHPVRKGDQHDPHLCLLSWWKNIAPGIQSLRTYSVVAYPLYSAMRPSTIREARQQLEYIYIPSDERRFGPWKRAKYGRCD